MLLTHCVVPSSIVVQDKMKLDSDGIGKVIMGVVVIAAAAVVDVLVAVVVVLVEVVGQITPVSWHCLVYST